MSRVRVPLHGKPQGYATLDTEATKGATVGVNLFWSDGTLVTEADFSPGPAEGGNVSTERTLWTLVAGVPANVQAVAALESSGFVRRESGGTWVARGLQHSDLPTLTDTGTGAALYKFTRDAYGRVEGTEEATAADLPYDNTASGLSADNAQDAIDELASGGVGGGVQSIVAGTNITVDDTDPANPIISASGGGGLFGGVLDGGNATTSYAGVPAFDFGSAA